MNKFIYFLLFLTFTTLVVYAEGEDAEVEEESADESGIAEEASDNGAFFCAGKLYLTIGICLFVRVIA